MSIFPKADCAVSNRCLTSSTLATSAWTAMALAPSSWMRSTIAPAAVLSAA
jgi:hypothetical protein